MAGLLIEFEDHQEEKVLIGEILTAYGEFEFILAQLLCHLFKNNTHTAARVLFRVKGESARIEVVDAMLRPEMDAFGLGGKWGNALGALRYCKEVRNQYAHCHWFKDGEKPLCFMNLDSDVTSASGEVIVQFEPVDLPLIQKQHQYFEYTLGVLYFLEDRFRTHFGESSDGFPEPISIPQPPKSNLKAILAASSKTEKS
jgi:hypothetical protein